MGRLSQIISKLIFCIKINRFGFQTLSFIKNSKKYSKAYKTDSFEKSGSENAYLLSLYGKKSLISIRTHMGDFDMFYEIFWKKIYEIDESVALQQYLSIVDLGANVGYTAIYFSHIFPQARIISIEPEKGNFDLLVKNTFNINNIERKQIAISESRKKVTMSTEKYSYNYKILNENTNEGSMVDAYSIFELLQDFNLKKIDLLKIDIEGEEKNILSKNNDWLSMVNSIIIELHTPYQIGDFINDLHRFGFSFCYPNKSRNKEIIYAFKTGIVSNDIKPILKL